jgi:predicted amino acid racemase
MAELSSLATQIEAMCGFPLEIVSGGNSASLPWAFGGGNTGRINDLRLGEAILLGVEPVSGRRIDGLHTDAFTIIAEVIESKIKPAGNECRAFEPGVGLIPRLSYRRRIQQSILAIGYQDTDIDGLSPPPGVTQIGATSDHLVVETADVSLAIGSEVSLQPKYSALMRIMSAPNVEKVMRNREPHAQDILARRSRTALALV